MTQVPMMLTKGQGQRSMFKFPPNGLNTKQLAISWISPTDFIISVITAFCDSFERCPLVLILHFVCIFPSCCICCRQKKDKELEHINQQNNNLDVRRKAIVTRIKENTARKKKVLKKKDHWMDKNKKLLDRKLFFFQQHSNH